MKSSSILSTCMMALAATTAAAPTDADVTPVTVLNATALDDPNDIPVWCERKNSMLGLSWRWNVYIKGVDDQPWPPLCDKFWKNLKKHAFFCGVSRGYCGPAGHPQDGLNHILNWAFDTPLFCQSWHVSAAYWEATDDKYGKMDERKCK
ncbi:hypothetical protein INS49_015388 [Diaporthe citri]|uniref:uncharacterized protein n=1 Tax=Diaporthe citri TaxID=83186 RepID=UPI001C7F857B|nr:uncharacterized protein INS49_015388 [Diaporthe citri]KAG6356003.1 hypothetical protein INS49_015388 [Diaporthe citri]